MQTRNLLLTLPVLLLACVVILIAAHSLIDPDLGWNLAGGLYILDNFKVPLADPLAAYSYEWIDYCFLPQILFAAVFKAGGFPGLVVLQTLVPVLTFLSGCKLIFDDGSLDNQAALRKSLFSVLLAGGLILFIAPIFHLRPQLFSVWFFILFLGWRLSSRESKLSLAVLMALWSSTHVYWIFGPLILAVDYCSTRVTEKTKQASLTPLLIACLAPVISPYGVKNYLPILQYSLFHSHVKEMIQEFQSLIFTDGYLLPATVLLMLTIFYFWFRNRISTANFVLAVIFFGLALWQMKFTPIFGTFGVISIATAKNLDPIRIDFSKLVPSYFLSFFFAGIASVFVSPFVGPTQKELLEAGKFLSQFNETFMSQFNSGGWLELGLYLAAPESNAKPLIDGRTLVMGEERLNDYFLVSTHKISFSDYLEKYQIKTIILNRRSPLTEESLGANFAGNVIFESENYLVLSRSLISAKSS